MQSVYTPAQLEALQVPVLEGLALHLAGQTYPLVRLAIHQRPDMAALVRACQATDTLACRTHWVGGDPRVSGAPSWLVVEVERPAVTFALVFPRPAPLLDQTGEASSHTLTLLLDGCPQAANAVVFAEHWLWPLITSSVTLTLDAAASHHLAEHLVGWPAQWKEAPLDERSDPRQVARAREPAGQWSAQHKPTTFS